MGLVEPPRPEQVRATTAAEAFWTLNPHVAVAPSDPWYVELSSSFPDRSYHFVDRLVKHLNSPQKADHQHVALVGHRGVGKSTLVRKAMQVLERHDFAAVTVDVNATLDQGDFTFADVVVALANAVAAVLVERKVALPAAELEQFRGFFTEEILTEEHTKSLSGTVETEAEAGAALPFLAKLLARVTALVRSENVYRQEIRRRVDRNPAAMVERASLFFEAAAAAMNKRLVVVFDNLEKIAKRELVETAILRRSHELRSLRLSAVYFLHPADEYAPRTMRASEAFDVVHLPMLPVREQHQRYDHVSDEALDAITNLLDRRMDCDKVFDDAPACVRKILALSGGRLRDVLEIARGACELVSDGKISVDMVVRAARTIAGYRAALLAADDVDLLVGVGNTKSVPNDDKHSYLLLHSMILQYNGVPWWDVHPILRLLPVIAARVGKGE